MIKLLIDGSEVHLAADISLEFYDRNPFFTSEGQHTLDIDISLADPVNAVIYNAMHRIDVAGRPQNRQAILYCEKGVIIKGTEIILEIDERNAKIQIVSGNSEFNYLIGGDRYLRDLDLGSVENLTEQTATLSMYRTYETFDYVCTPVAANVKIYGEGCNELHSKSIIYNEINEKAGATSVTIKSGTTLCPQPYLAAIIRRVVNALGYTIKNNAIDNNKELSKLIIVHGYKTLQYNRMVENWTVADFVSEVEHLCGVFFIVDNNNKTLDIQKFGDYYKSAECEEITKDCILGDINKKYDQDAPDNLVYHNVAYKFPDTSFYRFYSIDPEFDKRIEYVLCPDMYPLYDTDYFHLYNIWYKITGGNDLDKYGEPPQSVKDAYRLMKCYVEGSIVFEGSIKKRIPIGFPFIVRSINPESTCLTMIDQFGPRVDETSNDKMELKLVPIELAFSHLHDYYSYPIPIVENGEGDTGLVHDADEGKGVAERLKSGESSSPSAKDNMFVGFYMGVSRFDVNGEQRADKYPVVPVTINSRLLVWTRQETPVGATKFWTHQTVMYVNADGNYDLSINSQNGMYNTYWKMSLQIDLSTVYVIRFRSLQRRDARHLFNIGGRKFYCQQLKYEAVGGRLSDVIEGTFYPLK